MTVTDVPANLTYGRVVGRFLSNVGDASDLDDVIDAVPQTGEVDFVCDAPYLLDVLSTPPATFIPAPVTCTIDSEGYMVDPDGNAGVSLVASDAEVNPSMFTYQVTLRFAGTPARTFPIVVPAGEEVDLTLLSPATTSSGAFVVKGDRGEKGDKGDKGDTGDPGIADDASVAALVSNPASQTTDKLNDLYSPWSKYHATPIGQGEDRLRVSDFFGYKGDGTGTDLIPIQAALDQAAAGGPNSPKIVEIGRGVHQILPGVAGVGIVVPTGVSLVFAPGAVVKAGGAMARLIDCAGGNAHILSDPYCGATIDGNGYVTSELVRFNANSGGRMHGVTLRDTGYACNYGFNYFGLNENTEITKCVITDLQTGIRLNSSPQRMLLEHCVITGWINRGIYLNAVVPAGSGLTGADGVRMRKNRLYAPGVRPSYAVTNKALTGNVATLTIGTHNRKVGDAFYVSGVDATFDGTNVLTAVDLVAGTISYARVAADVASVAATGTARYDGTMQPISSQGSPGSIQHTNLWVVENYVTGPDRSFIDLTNPGTPDQISIQGAMHVTIYGNHSYRGGDVGITVGPDCEDVLVECNHCHFNDTYGIAVGAATLNAPRYVTIRNNHCFDNGQDRTHTRSDISRGGIRPGKGYHVYVAGNVTGNRNGGTTQKYGISTSLCDNLFIGQNDLFDNAVAGLFIDDNCTKVEFDRKQGSSLRSTFTVGPSDATEKTVFTAEKIVPGALDATKSTFRLRVGGNFEGKATSGSYTVRIYINGTLLLSVLFANSQTALFAATPWYIDGLLYVDNTGAGGQVSFDGAVKGFSSAAAAVIPASAQADAVAINLSTGFTVSVAVQMQTSDVANIVRAKRGVLQWIS